MKRDFKYWMKWIFSIPVAIASLVLIRLFLMSALYFLSFFDRYGISGSYYGRFLDKIIVEGASIFCAIMLFYNFVPDFKRTSGSIFCITLLVISGFSLMQFIFVSKEYFEAVGVAAGIAATTIALFQIRDGKAPSLE